MNLVSSLLLLAIAIPKNIQATHLAPRDTKKLLPAVAQAIEDEIYDMSHEDLYFQIDNNPGGEDSPAHISMYVSKTVTANGVGVVIYKDMPQGEVYRYFNVENDGTIKLMGDPTSKFPPHGGSMLTIYMTDEQVCNFIHNKAYKFEFVINPLISKKLIRAAENRQIRRTGYSFRSIKNKKSLNSSH